MTLAPSPLSPRRRPANARPRYLSRAGSPAILQRTLCSDALYAYAWAMRRLCVCRGSGSRKAAFWRPYKALLPRTRGHPPRKAFS